MSRTFSAVTTFSAAGRRLYGERMIESFYRHWPSDVLLSVYDDGLLPRWLQAFKARHAHNPRSNGMAKGSYDFRFDAVKFAHKTAAIIEGGIVACDILIWLDGDIVTHAPVTLGFLESLLPESAALAWLDRTGSYPECGFVMYNLRHHAMAGILARWRSLYETDALFGFPEWHDSFVLQRIVEDAGVEVASLSGEARTTSHPLARGPMADYFDHRKGARKALDHSPEHRVLA